MKGEPLRFVRGHNSVGMDRSKPHKTNRYEVRDCGHTTPCWIWKMKHVPSGYGSVGVAGRQWLAHRWYYEQARGTIPEGMQLDHLCRQRSCVNPAHLEPVTPLVNTRRSRTMRLSDDDAFVIEQRRRAGETIRSLAAEFGVSKETVRLIGIAGASAPRAAGRR